MSEGLNLVIGVSSLLSFSDRLKAELTPMRGEKREEEEGGRGGHYGLAGGDVSLPSFPPWGGENEVIVRKRGELG